MTYQSVHTKAEKMRHAIRLAKMAKDMVPLDLGPAEECLEGIEDDFDAAIRKGEAALDRLDALVSELEDGAEEEESADRYVVVGRGA